MKVFGKSQKSCFIISFISDSSVMCIQHTQLTPFPIHAVGSRKKSTNKTSSWDVLSFKKWKSFVLDSETPSLSKNRISIFFSNFNFQNKIPNFGNCWLPITTAQGPKNRKWLEKFTQSPIKRTNFVSCRHFWDDSLIGVVIKLENIHVGLSFFFLRFWGKVVDTYKPLEI